MRWVLFFGLQQVANNHRNLALRMKQCSKWVNSSREHQGHCISLIRIIRTKLKFKWDSGVDYKFNRKKLLFVWAKLGRFMLRWLCVYSITTTALINCAGKCRFLMLTSCLGSYNELMKVNRRRASQVYRLNVILQFPDSWTSPKIILGTFLSKIAINGRGTEVCDNKTKNLMAWMMHDKSSADHRMALIMIVILIPLITHHL